MKIRALWFHGTSTACVMGVSLKLLVREIRGNLVRCGGTLPSTGTLGRV